MIINHRVAQLGVVNQKRPEVWQSYLRPKFLQDDLAQVSLSADGDHKLREIAFDKSISEKGIDVGLSVGDHKLVSMVKTNYATDDTVSVGLSVGDHKLVSMVKSIRTTDDTISVGLSVGDHKLSNWGIWAEVLDKDNVKVSLAVGDHKLYEEQS